MANLSGPPELDDASLETAEARMRRALGDLDTQAHGNGRAANDTARPRGDARAAERHTGDRPRARFVQDGDVPVTVLHRARPHEGEAPNGGSSRLNVAEAALASERTARSRAERALAELQATVHDLQTKWGHAELARQELAGRLEADKAAFEAERAAFQQHEQALNQELEAERTARTRAESAPKPGKRAARAGVAATAIASDPAEPVEPEPAAMDVAAPMAKRKAQRKLAGSKKPEPKPVKWWLSAVRKK